MKSLNCLSDIVDHYDVLLLDLWGVIHDGTALYPGVHDALELLSAKDKTVIFLSNAPRRAAKVKAVLKGLGVEEGLYLDALSSGEIGFRWLAAGKAPWGKRYFFIGASKDADMPDGLDIVRVDDIKQADFILCLGFGNEEQTTEDFNPLLRAGKAMGLPMLCLNPDLEVVKITGERQECAGVIGKAYERLGGQVTWFGKPYHEVYDACMALVNVDKSRVLAVGDSLETDIPGGQRYGVDTMLVTGGILKKLSLAQIEAQCASLGLSPTYVAPALGGAKPAGAAVRAAIS